MVLNFTKILQQALENIDFTEHHEFTVYDLAKERTHLNSDEVIELYGNTKWKVVDILNEKYSVKFDLHNWLYKNKNDEVAYFINEVGSNSLSYSQFKAPYRFHLWLGKKGFILGIEQKGQGFNAQHIHENRIQQNEGAAFNFFRECKSKIFFDDPQNVRVVFMHCKLNNRHNCMPV